MTDLKDLARRVSELQVMGLTFRQADMLLELRNGQPREYALGMAGRALQRKGLVTINELGARHLTDKGHEVAAALIARSEA